MEMEVPQPPSSGQQNLISMSTAQYKPNFSNIIPPQLCPVCSCPFSHLQQPPADEDTRTVSTGSSVSSSNVDPTLNFPQSTLPQAPRFPLPALAPVSFAATAPPPNQILNAATDPHARATNLPSSSLNPSPNGPLELPMHKNRLQEYAQRSSLPLPEYNTVNEGLPHAPQFRSSVIVDGMKYTSVNTFSRTKAAEQEVARISMESILKNAKEEGSPLINRIGWQDTVVCKSILNEFAIKMNMLKPTYNTVQPRASIPIFASSLVLNDTTYTGGPGQNKEEAEWLAAWAAILSLMGNSGFETVLSEVIKSKDKLFDALYKAKDLNQVHTIFELEGVNANANANAGSSHPPLHEFKVPKQETSPMTTIPLTEFVPPAQKPFIAFIPRAQEQQFTGLVQNLGKRKNRKSKKAKKKVRVI